MQHDKLLEPVRRLLNIIHAHSSCPKYSVIVVLAMFRSIVRSSV